jgi:hypothetical protein
MTRKLLKKKEAGKTDLFIVLNIGYSLVGGKCLTTHINQFNF